jgi:hypothetical protein
MELMMMWIAAPAQPVARRTNPAGSDRFRAP